MAQFRYLGEPARPGLVLSYDPLGCTQISVPKANGAKLVLNKATGFVIGAIITDDLGAPIEFTDSVCLLVLRAETDRYQEVV